METSKEEMESLAMSIENVKKNMEGKEIVKVITIPSKLVNIVVKQKVYVFYIYFLSFIRRVGFDGTKSNSIK